MTNVLVRCNGTRYILELDFVTSFNTSCSDYMGPKFGLSSKRYGEYRGILGIKDGLEEAFLFNIQ